MPPPHFCCLKSGKYHVFLSSSHLHSFIRLRNRYRLVEIALECAPPPPDLRPWMHDEPMLLITCIPLQHFQSVPNNVQQCTTYLRSTVLVAPPCEQLRPSISPMSSLLGISPKCVQLVMIWFRSHVAAPHIQCLFSPNKIAIR